MFDIVTIGAATRDVFLKSKDFEPRRVESSPSESNLVLPLGDKLEVDEIIFESGGGATNAAVTFARQGLQTACVCRVGEDPGGRAVVDSLKEEGVDIYHVIRDQKHYTGYSVILSAVGGERVILVYRGSSNHFDELIIPQTPLSTRWLFITSLAGNVPLLDKLLTWSDNQKINTAVIPGSAELEKGEAALAPMFARAEVVIMNRQEAADLTGIDINEKEKIINKTASLTKGVCVITDASFGATACDGRAFFHIGTHGNKAVERTGAGDAFASGFVAGLMKFSGDISKSLQLAADNASSVVNFFGAKKGILKKDQPSPFTDKLEVKVIPIK